MLGKSNRQCRESGNQCIGRGNKLSGMANTDLGKNIIKNGVNAGVQAASSATTTLAATAFQNINFSKLGTDDWFNTENFKATMADRNTWTGAIASGVSSFAGGMVTTGLSQ